METTPMDKYSLIRIGERFGATHKETGATISLMITREEIRSVGKKHWRKHIKLLDKGNGIFGVFSEKPIVHVDEDELFDGLDEQVEAKPKRRATAKAPF
jgi:hypothetical protein